MNGEVVGINSAKLASTAVEGIGYAIAISDVTDTLESLMNEETRDKVDNHGVLGITVKSVDSAVSEAYGVPEGVLVRDVTVQLMRLVLKQNPSLQNLQARLLQPRNS